MSPVIETEAKEVQLATLVENYVDNCKWENELELYVSVLEDLYDEFLSELEEITETEIFTESQFDKHDYICLDLVSALRGCFGLETLENIFPKNEYY